MTETVAGGAAAPRTQPHQRSGILMRIALWELRGSLGRLFYWLLCLTVGTAAVVAIDGLARSLDLAIRSEAKSLLAADLAVSSRQPLSDEVSSAIDALPGSRHVELRQMFSIVSRGSDAAPTDGARSLLVELKSISVGHPFYGELELSGLESGSDPKELVTVDAARLDTILQDGTALIGREAADRLNLAAGDPLRVGKIEVEVAGIVESEPDRVPGMLTIGPPVLVRPETLERAELVSATGMTRYKTLVALPAEDPAALDRAVEQLEETTEADPFVRVETYRQAQPALRRGLEQMESYLGLVALLSLLIGGVGIAQGVRAWVASRLDSLAVLKCLGVRPREALAAYLIQATLLGLAGTALGGLIGLALLAIVPLVLSDMIPPEAVSIWQPLSLARGVALGLIVALVFSAGPLVQVLRVSPARVFRRTANAAPGSRWLGPALVVGTMLAIALIAAIQSGSFVLAAQFVGGVLASTALLAVASWLVARFGRALSRRTPRAAPRYGLANLARSGSGTLSATTALGLGLLVVLTMVLVQGHLRDQLQSELPDEAPTTFMTDIRRPQWPEVQALLREAGAERIDGAPLIQARIDSIDGRGVAELLEEGGDRWALRREQRITTLEALPDDNVIVEARSFDRLWSDPDIAEVSVEREFAEELGLGLGSELVLDVGGQPQPFVVTSLRTVDWESFGINFFLVVEPGTLDEARQTVLATARVPRDTEQALQDRMADVLPNVTMVRIRQLLDKLTILLNRLEVGVRFLGGFTVLAGLAILAGAVATTSAQRGDEVALLKTLGLTRRGVLTAFAAEYVSIGLAAALIAGVGATSIAWFVVTQELEIAWTWRPWDLVWVLGSGVALATLVGLIASLRALARPPIAVLGDR